MPKYMVERYLPSITTDQLAAARAKKTMAEMSKEGTPIRGDMSTLVMARRSSTRLAAWIEPYSSCCRTKSSVARQPLTDTKLNVPYILWTLIPLRSSKRVTNHPMQSSLLQRRQELLKIWRLLQEPAGQ